MNSRWVTVENSCVTNLDLYLSSMHPDLVPRMYIPLRSMFSTINTPFVSWHQLGHREDHHHETLESSVADRWRDSLRPPACHHHWGIDDACDHDLDRTIFGRHNG